MTRFTPDEHKFCNILSRIRNQSTKSTFSTDLDPKNKEGTQYTLGLYMNPFEDTKIKQHQ